MKSFIMRHRGKFVIGICVVFLLCSIPFIFLFGDILKDSALERLNRQHFDSQAWKLHLKNDDSNPIKLRMVDDLLAHHDLVGMKQIQINELLGIPAKTTFFRDYDYVYWLGPERGWMSIDSEWLALKFDRDGSVMTAKIVRD